MTGTVHIITLCGASNFACTCTPTRQQCVTFNQYIVINVHVLLIIIEVNPDDARGIPGNKGNKGINGTEGDKGLKGNNGTLGNEGPMGYKGIK